MVKTDGGLKAAAIAAKATAKEAHTDESRGKCGHSNVPETATLGAGD
jgi:hypothetical protein